MSNIEVIDPETFIEDIDNDDNNYCTVIALAVVTGASFMDCQKYLSKFGRKKRKGLTTHNLENALSKSTKFRFRKGSYSFSNRISLNQFIKKHPKGKYYIVSRGHAYAVIDGVIYDYKESKRRQVIRAWRVYTKEEVEELRKHALHINE